MLILTNILVNYFVLKLFSISYRYLKFLGYEVEYVRNFTDIDDKVIICPHHFSWYASVVDKMEGTLSFVYWMSYVEAIFLWLN